MRRPIGEAGYSGKLEYPLDVFFEGMILDRYQSDAALLKCLHGRQTFGLEELTALRNAEHIVLYMPLNERISLAPAVFHRNDVQPVEKRPGPAAICAQNRYGLSHCSFMLCKQEKLWIDSVEHIQTLLMSV